MLIRREKKFAVNIMLLLTNPSQRCHDKHQNEISLVNIQHIYTEKTAELQK